MGRIVDIAEKAGVSSKTVSRVINGHPNISAKTRWKVEEAIRALSYEPRSAGSGRNRGSNRAVGVFFGDPSAGFQVCIYRALLRACQTSDHFLAVEAFRESGNDWSSQVAAFLDRSQVRKIVLVPPLCDSYEIQNLLKERDVRFALISPSRPVSGVQAIAMDDRRAAMEMTQHLLGLGHRRIGYLDGRPGHVATLLRRQGFEEAYAVAGLPAPDESLILRADFSFRTALDRARTLLEREDRPTAIFASNDEMAAAALFVANHLGLSVPEDLSVSGFDGAEISRTVWPELTTIAQPFDEMAERAIEQIIDPVDAYGRDPGVRVLSHQLIIRASTGPAPA